MKAPPMSFCRAAPVLLVAAITLGSGSGVAQTFDKPRTEITPDFSSGSTTGVTAGVQTVEAQIESLSRILMVDQVIEVMRLEGLDYGAGMEDDLFPGRGGTSWRTIINLIYDPVTMKRRFDTAFAAEIGTDPAAIAAMQAFFGDARGQRIVTLEIEARRSLMDDAIEDAARARIEDMDAAGDPRLDALRQFVEANDLIDANVSGALNANLAFFQGMAESGALGEDMTEDQMLSDVWAQEADIRKETEAWIYPYLALAYGPLSDDDLADYIGFSRTDAGRRLNTALFRAFDAVFVAVSRDLGLAAAKQTLGQDI